MQPEVPVALRRRGLGRPARHRVLARRHDDRRLGVALGDRPVHVLAVVGAVAGERGDRVLHLVEQRPDPGAVVGLAGRSAPRPRSGRCRRPRRGAASARPGASSCRASRPATRRARPASGPCCRPAGAAARRPERGRGTSSVAARRDRVVWSGTARSSPSRRRIEPIRPSVWRRPRRNTARSVSAVRIARGEYQGCPPRVVRGSARQAATASSVNQTVRLPRWRRAASYAAQLVTRCRCLGMRWRRAALALNGTAGVRGSWEGPLPYATRPPDATRTDPCTKVARQRHPEAARRGGEALRQDAGLNRAGIGRRRRPGAGRGDREAGRGNGFVVAARSGTPLPGKPSR